MMAVMQWNARGVRTSIPDLQYLVAQQQPFAFLLNETFFGTSSEVPNIANYTMIRTDRHSPRPLARTNRGGVAALIHPSLKVTRVKRFHHKVPGSVPSEWLAVTVSPRHSLTLLPGPITIVTGYRSLLAGPHLNWILTQFTEAGHQPCIFAGDLNIDPRVSDPLTTAFREQLDLNGLHLIESGPTRYGVSSSSLLDIWIINDAAAHIIRSTTVTVGCKYSSDHCVTSINLLTESPGLVHAPTGRGWDYAAADWRNYADALNAALASVQKPSPGDPVTSIDEYDSAIREAILHAARSSIPTAQERPRRTQFSPEMLTLRHNRNRLEALWKQFPDPEIRIRLRDTCAAIKRQQEAEEAQRSSRKLYRAANAFRQGKPQDAWELLRHATRRGNRRSSVAPLTRSDGTVATSPAEQTELFVEHWKAVFQHPPDHGSHGCPEVTESATAVASTYQPSREVKSPLENEYSLQPADVWWGIRRARKSAPGSDQITNTILRHATPTLVDHLTNLFNHSVSSQYVPRFWLQSVTVPVPKPGKPPDSVLGYRPISLAPCIGKLMERIIARDLQAVWNDRGVLPDNQFAFQQGKGAADAAIVLAHRIHVASAEQQESVITTLDVQAAYDSVWIDGLILRLHQSPIGESNLVGWIKSLITDRRMAVRVNGCTSESFPLQTGIPQGSPLSPLLYITFTAPLLQLLGTSAVAYADDVTLLTCGHSTAMAAAKTQALLRLVEQWASTWRVKFNPDKSQVMAFAHYHKNPVVSLDGAPIPAVRSVKILGIHFTPRMGWSLHVSNRLQAANRAAFLFLRMARRPGPPLVKKLVYTATIRSIMEYGHPVWATAPNWLERKLQRSQNKCLRSILPARGLTDRRRHAILKLPTMPDRLHSLRVRYAQQIFTEEKRTISAIVSDARYGRPQAYHSPAMVISRLIGPAPIVGPPESRNNSRTTAFIRRIVMAGGTRTNAQRRRRSNGLPPIIDDRRAP